MTNMLLIHNNILGNFIKHCHNTLISGQEADAIVAREYLSKRKIRNVSWEDHQIGYCLDNIDLSDLNKIYQKSNEDGFKRDYSRYIKGRVIIPIYQEFGMPIALATRKPTFEQGHSWWNVPFTKGSNLFLLSKTKRDVFAKNKIYIVEGYMDAITLYQNGLKNVACVMGTALTLRHISLIARYCNNICLCFDVDKNVSGQKATAVSLSLLKKYNFCDKISVIQSLPVGEDPASYVSQFGIQEFLGKEEEMTDSKIKAFVKQYSSSAEKEHLYAR